MFLMETVGRFLKKINVEILFDSALLLLGATWKINTKRSIYAYVHISTVYNGQIMEPT